MKHFDCFCWSQRGSARRFIKNFGGASPSSSAQVRFGEPGAPVQFLMGLVRRRSAPRLEWTSVPDQILKPDHRTYLTPKIFIAAPATIFRAGLCGWPLAGGRKIVVSTWLPAENCARPPGGAGGKKRVNASRGWLRIMSSMGTRCTQETVQKGAQGFLVEYSRSRSAWVYFSSGIAG